MGHRPADDASIEARKEEIEEFGIDRRVYPYLDAIFRQCMMRVPDAPFSYQKDWQLPLDGTQTPLQIEEALDKYIEEWQAKFDLEFGFSKIEITEYSKDDGVICKFNLLVDDVKTLLVEAGFFDHQVIEKLVSSLANQAKLPLSQFSLGYTQELKDGGLSLALQKHDSIAHYIGYSAGLFSDFIKRKEDLVKFIYRKLIWEHDQIEQIKGTVNKRMIRDRLRKSDGRYGKLSQEVVEEYFVSKDLLEHFQKMNEDYDLD